MNSPQSFIYTSDINELKKNKNELDNFSYISKFKTAVYGFFLFIILSQKITYKVINMIINAFIHNNDIINDNEEPLPLGLFINACILALILFIF
jgi:hypothetical protein